MRESTQTMIGLFSDIEALHAAELALGTAQDGVELMLLENLDQKEESAKKRQEELDFGHFFGKLFGFQTDEDVSANSGMRAYFAKHHPGKQHILVVKNPNDILIIRQILETNGAIVEDLPQIH